MSMRPGSPRLRRVVATAALALALAGCTSPDGAAPTPTPTPASASATPSPGSGTGGESSGTGSPTGAGTAGAGPGGAASSPAGRTGPGAYAGAERVEKALRVELGQDAELTVEDAAAVQVRLRNEGLDIMGPLDSQGTPECSDARRAATDAALDGLRGRTMAQAGVGDHGVRKLTVISFVDDAVRARVDVLQRAARQACGTPEAPHREEVAVPFDEGEGSEAVFRQDVIAGYPDSSTDQMVRTGRASGGDVVLLELFREGCSGCMAHGAPPLTSYAAERVPRFEELIARVAG